VPGSGATTENNIVSSGVTADSSAGVSCGSTNDNVKGLPTSATSTFDKSSLCRDQFAPPPTAHIKAEDFLQNSGGGPGRGMSEVDLTSFVQDGHNVMMKVLSSRNSSLQVVKAMWSSGNVKTAIESALHMNDLAVTFDVLSVMLTRSSLWTLDLCVLLIPALSELTTSKYNNYIRCGLDGLKQILRQFAPIIKGNITVPPTASVGVDISREERYHKCMSCYKLLMNVRSNLENRLSLPDEMASHIRELRLLMAQLD
jgi:katanin p80 WD40 repeat-containing subunit B1